MFTAPNHNMHYISGHFNIVALQYRREKPNSSHSLQALSIGNRA